MRGPCTIAGTGFDTSLQSWYCPFPSLERSNKFRFSMNGVTAGFHAIGRLVALAVSVCSKRANFGQVQETNG